MTHVDHAWRHRPKALGGTDPIEFTSAGAFTSYYDCVLADPTTVNFWPMNDASGNLTDIVGGTSLTVTAHAGWPLYQSTGPFVGLPAQSAVENDNGNVSGALAGQARFSFAGAMPSGTTPFTLQGWIVCDNLTFGGIVWNSSQIYIDVIGGSGGAMNVNRGGVALTGAVAAQGVWTHIRLDYDGTTLRLFQDFALKDTDTGGSIASGGTVSFLNDKPPAVNWGPFVGRAALWSLHDDVATTCDPEGSGGSSAAPEGYAPLADGSGGVTWTDVATQTELDVSDAAFAAHVADTTDAHDATAVSITDAGGYYTGAEVEAALQEIGLVLEDVETGRWELVMADGVTAPPVPVETEAQDDWVYALVED